MSDAKATARRIAARATVSFLGPLPDDVNDPATEPWWELNNTILQAAEDEIGRVELLRLGEEERKRESKARRLDRCDSCNHHRLFHPNCGVIGRDNANDICKCAEFVEAPDA